MSPQNNRQTSRTVREPVLILMKGHPGSGKSTLAAALARAFGWALLDKDDIKDHLLDVPNGNALAYEILWAMTGRVLSINHSVIVDSPLSYPQSYATGQALAERFGAWLLIVEAQPAQSVWQARLEARPPDASRHKIAGWAAMQALLADYDGCWRYPIDPAHHLVVDTGGSVADALAVVSQRLGTAPQHGAADSPTELELTL